MTDKEALKKRGDLLKELRARHAQTVARTQELMKEQKRLQIQVCQCIRDTAKTVPEIAAETGLPTHEVLWYLTASKKYDIVIEEGMCGDYVLYKRIPEKSA